MRLPLLIMPHLTPEEAAIAYPTYKIIISGTQPPQRTARLLAECVCCVGQNALRDTLNGFYLEWARNNTALEGVVLIPPPEASLADLEEFLTEEAILWARFAAHFPAA